MHVWHYQKVPLKILKNETSTIWTNAVYTYHINTLRAFSKYLKDSEIITITGR